MAEQTRLGRQDWFILVLCGLLGVGLSGLALWLLLTTLLEPVLMQERALRTNRNVRLVEKVLESVPLDQLPSGVIIDHSPKGPEEPEEPEDQPPRFDPEFLEYLKVNYGLQRQFRVDRPPLLDPWGGFWIRLEVPNLPGPPIWLYQPERLTSNVWFLPLLRTLAVVLGLTTASILFLKYRLERPLGRMLEQLQTGARPPLPLLPEQGVAPLRQLTFRINRLLESINDAERARTSLLRGVAHDLASPQTRLMLQAESLRDSVDASHRNLLDAMENDLNQLAAITEQLVLLADETLPTRRRSPIGLDDLCARVMGSYPSGSIQLQVPRLLIIVDSLGLERSLCNLIDNALEYGKPPVRISARRLGSSLRLQVEDHGSGMVSSTQLTMTRPPAADDRQRSRHRGLGLQIVDRFCRDHAGRLQLERSRLGGLSATIRLNSTAADPLFI